MVAEIRRIGVALGIPEGGLLKVARDIAQNGTLLSLAHLREYDQGRMLDFLRLVEETETRQAKRERFFDSMVA